MVNLDFSIKYSIIKNQTIIMHDYFITSLKIIIFSNFLKIYEVFPGIHTLITKYCNECCEIYKTSQKCKKNQKPIIRFASHLSYSITNCL